MRKQFMGKYASGNRKAAEQEKAERDFIKSLPLAIRKLMKERDQACATLCEMLNNVDRDTYIAQRRIYDELADRVRSMIKTYTTQGAQA